MAEEKTTTTVPVVASTKPWLSKTLWMSAIAGVLPLIPVVNVWVATNPAVYGLVMAGVFAGLRLITKGKISIE